MTDRTPRSRPLPAPRTGDDAIDEAVRELVSTCNLRADGDLLTEMIANIVRLCREDSDRGELKLINSAIRDLRRASAQFAPYSDAKKVSIFGSARTRRDEEAYRATFETGKVLADDGWMVITGGGPGIMTAGIEGAGRDNSFGVTIRLPFEPMDGGGIVPMERLVRFRNFFGRKLTFMRQSEAFIVFPGGFGTMDELFEVLTLVQTGKATPMPVVLFEPEGDNYWGRWQEFIDLELVQAGLIATHDVDLAFTTSSTTEALRYINDFYRVYHSMRWVGDQLVIRLNHDLSDERLDALNNEFSDIVVSGSIERTTALAVEIDDDDVAHLPRILLSFDQRNYARLHKLVRSL